MTTGIVHGNGIDIRYRITGDGDQDLVLINGVGDDLDGWANQLDDFFGRRAARDQLRQPRRRGVRPAARPLHQHRDGGRPEGPGHRPRAGAASTWPGVSMGGVIAQEYALAHPADLRSLVLANTFAAADPFTAAAFETWATVALAAGMPVMMRQQAPWIFSPDFYARHPDRVTELIAAAQTSTQPPAAFAAQMAALTGHDCAARIGAVRVPTLVLAARDDIIIRPQLSRQLFDALADGVGTWAVVPGGHAAFWEDPGPWNRAVIEFVRASGAS